MVRKRSQEASLGRLLTASETPVYVIDDRRRIIYCNAACGAMLGLEPDQLVGRRCDYGVPDGADALAATIASLCPPPDVFAGIRRSEETTFVHASGSLVRRLAEHLPLGRDAVGGVGVVTVVCDAPTADAKRAADAEALDLHRRLVQLRQEVLAHWPIDALVGESPAVRRIRDQVILATRGKTRVVVHGPAGSGRSHVARLVHYRLTAERPGMCVPLCCPLLDAELLQSTITALARQSASPGDELLGRDRSTGAPAVPTLLLLEVDELAGDAQAELAGFLALPGFELSCVATARHPLTTLAEQGRFRVDLAHALSTLEIQMPSLKERREDLPVLGQYFLERFNARGGVQFSGFTPEAIDALYEYPWPENVDELLEVVESACRAADGPWIGPAELPDRIRWAHQAAARPKRKDEPVDLDQVLEDVERELITRAMSRAKGNKTKAAQMLGVTRARLHRRAEHFRLG
jgi:DNA-binding NtrC family response regulator